MDIDVCTSVVVCVMFCVVCTLLTTITIPCNFPLGVFFSSFRTLVLWTTALGFCTLRTMILESGNFKLYVQSTVLKHLHH